MTRGYSGGIPYGDPQCDEIESEKPQEMSFKRMCRNLIYHLKGKYRHKKRQYKHKILQYIGRTLSPKYLEDVGSSLGGDIGDLNELLKYADQNNYHEEPFIVSPSKPERKYEYNREATQLLCSVAGSSFVPVNILEQLYKIDNMNINMEDVRFEMLKNLRTPTNILYDITKQRQGIGNNRHYENLIANHVNANEDCFSILINSENPEVRAVVINRTKNIENITICLMDPHSGVKRAAENRYRELNPEGLTD